MHIRDFLKDKPRGFATDLAEQIGVHRVLMSQWTADEGARNVPAEHCAALERATGGAVTCEATRPDVRWHRVPDADWPHPDGRPLIEVASEAA